MARYTDLIEERENKLLDTENYSYDKYVGKVFSAYVVLNTCNVSLSLFFGDIFAGGLRTIAIGVIFLAFVLSSFRNAKRALRKMFIFFFIALLMFVVGWRFGFSNFSILVERFWWLFVFGIPLFGLFYGITDTRTVLFSSYRCIYFSGGISAFTIMKSLMAGGIKGDYSMALGYALLYPTLLAIVFFKTRKSFQIGLIILLNTFVIVSYGSRGQILCIGVFICLLELFWNKQITIKKIVLILSILTIGLLVYAFFKEILQGVIYLLEQIGIKSRTLYYFMERTTYTGRETVWADAINNISAKPFLGWTVGVDVSADGFYPHQLFLELFLHYGVLIGGFLSVSFIVILLKNLIIYREHDKLALLLFCYGVIPLFITSEYIVWPSFWAFLGICLSRNKRIIRLEMEI